MSNDPDSENNPAASMLPHTEDTLFSGPQQCPPSFGLASLVTKEFVEFLLRPLENHRYPFDMLFR